MIDGRTQVFGIIGCPVGHSASPRMHAAAYAAEKQNAIYVPFPVADMSHLPAAIAGIRALSIGGINVTIPYKEAVIPFLDSVDPDAMQAGAVNTIVNRNGILHGYNTDGDGLLLALVQEWGWEAKGKHVGIIGAGGSARGIALALCRASVAGLTVYSRTGIKTSALCRDISQYTEVPIVPLDVWTGVYDLVIQTTPAGMAGHNEGVLPLSDMSWVYPGQGVVDIVYKPEVTAFMREAQARGARVLGGAGMLAGQGVLAYRHMTGSECGYRVMRQVLGA